MNIEDLANILALFSCSTKLLGGSQSCCLQHFPVWVVAGMGKYFYGIGRGNKYDEPTGIVVCFNLNVGDTG